MLEADLDGIYWWIRTHKDKIKFWGQDFMYMAIFILYMKQLVVLDATLDEYQVTYMKFYTLDFSSTSV